MIFTPSIYQSAFFDALTNGTRNLQLVAVAGSGKTASLEEGVKRLPASAWSSVLMTAFNKHIEGELKSRQGAGRIPPGVAIKTIHGFGYGILMRALQPRDSKNWTDFNKYRKLTKAAWRDVAPGAVVVDIGAEEARRQREISENLTHELARLCLLTLTDPASDVALWSLVDRFGLELPASGDAIDTAISLVRRVVRWGTEGMPHRDDNGLNYHPSERISGEDMVYLPIALNLPVPKFDYLFVDEQQDLNRAQQELMLRARSERGRLILVGDPCQPGDSMVTVARKGGNRWNGGRYELVPISEITEGDRVVSYSPQDAAFIMNGRSVTGITRRPFDGELIVATLPNGTRSRYTPNHICYANFKPLEKHWCVYLMRRGAGWRIGKARVSYGVQGIGAVIRCRAESADAVWILSVHTTAALAAESEQVTAGAFGIPQLTFNAAATKGAQHMTNEALERVWGRLASFNLHSRALDCLANYGRKEQFPYWSSDERSFGKSRRPAMIRACNLIDGMLMLPFKIGESSHSRSENWQPIVLDRTPYRGDVYSLSVEGENLYVADGIVTHNCQAIYGFSGADAESFDRMRVLTNALSLPLSICYRCSKSVVRLAKQLVPAIEAAPDAVEGAVTYVGHDALLDTAASHFRDNPAEPMLIVCRVNAPLVSAAFDLIRRRVPARVKGRDIGQALVRTLDEIERMPGFDMAKFASFAGTWGSGKIAVLAQREGTEGQIEQISDRVKSLLTIQEYLAGQKDVVSAGDIRAEVQNLFAEETHGIMLSSIHKAKGLEARRVGILEAQLLPHPMAKQAWQVEQEKNLAYVAITRAREELYIAGTIQWGRFPMTLSVSTAITEQLSGVADEDFRDVTDSIYASVGV